MCDFSSLYEGKANHVGQAAKPAGQNEGRDVKMRREMFSMDAVLCVSLAVMLWVVIALGNHSGCFDDFFLCVSQSISLSLYLSLFYGDFSTLFCH